MMTIHLPHFENNHVLVYGDVMLDRYWHGDAARISPEAPVPVVSINQMEMRPGGAANVAQNIAALGTHVTLCGLVGDDAPAKELKDTLKHMPIDCQFLSAPDFLTITKLRVLGQHQQLIRLDFEKTTEPFVNDDALFATYCEQLSLANVVVLSDYSKGALCHIERLVTAARKKNVPILIDPKNKDYQRYAGATMLTPNLKEFEAVVGSCRHLSEITQKAQELLKKIHIGSLLITLGKDGMVYVTPDKEPVHFHAKARDVFDVTGAGDTVIAVLAAGIAAGMEMLSAIELANLAAGIVVGRLGAQAVTLSDLQHALLESGDLTAGALNEKQLLLMVAQARARGEKIIMTNGCFDILHVGHVDYLSKAKALGDRLIVAVNDDDSVRRLKGDSRPLNSIDARMRMLTALHAVDWVVSFSEDTPARLIEAVKPDVLVKGGDYRIEQIAGYDAVIQNGGEVRIIPLVDGYSTTGLIKKIEERSCVVETRVKRSVTSVPMPNTV